MWATYVAWNKTILIENLLSSFCITNTKSTCWVACLWWRSILGIFIFVSWSLVVLSLYVSNRCQSLIVSRFFSQAAAAAVHATVPAPGGGRVCYCSFCISLEINVMDYFADALFSRRQLRNCDRLKCREASAEQKLLVFLRFCWCVGEMRKPKHSRSVCESWSNDREKHAAGTCRFIDVQHHAVCSCLLFLQLQPRDKKRIRLLLALLGNYSHRVRFGIYLSQLTLRQALKLLLIRRMPLIKYSNLL